MRTHLTRWVGTPEVIRLLMDGCTPTEIIESVPDSSYARINYWRKRLGLPEFGHKQGLLKTEVRQEARKLKSDGMSYAQIGRRIGVSRQRVQQYCEDGESANGSICVCCGLFKKRMHRHHINYITGEKINLCVSCHTKTHNKEKKL